MKHLQTYYRSKLQELYETILQKNPSYSQNSYAKYLGVTTSYYSKMMSGKIGLSLNIADKITKKLNMSSEERKAFIFSVAEEHHWQSLYQIDTSYIRPDTLKFENVKL